MDVLVTIDGHLARFVTLSNRTARMSKYIAKHIMMMIPQIVGMRYYINGLWQESLNEFYAASHIESKLLSNGRSHTLVFARSIELLATHLIMIYKHYQKQPVNIV